MPDELEKARRAVNAAKTEFSALHRDALGDPPAAYVQRIRDAWCLVELKIYRLCKLERLAALEEADETYDYGIKMHRLRPLLHEARRVVEES